MKEEHAFRFEDGVCENGSFNLTFDDARLKALGVAKSSGFAQTMLVYSKEQRRWIKLGTWYPEGFYVDSLNWVNVMNDKNDGLYVIGKLGEEYTREYVLTRQNSHAHIINAAKNKIEYDNGLMFAYNFRTDTYHISFSRKGGAK